MAKDDKNQEDSEYAFPEGCEHFEEMAKETAQRMRDLDTRIKAIPTEDIKRTAYRLQFNPAGLEKAKNAWNNREDRKELEKEKQQLEADLNKRVERDIKGWELEPETASQVRVAVMETVFPNPFKGKTKEELKVIKGMEKDFQHSQDFMRTLLSNERKPQSPQPPGRSTREQGPGKE